MFIYMFVRLLQLMMTTYVLKPPRLVDLFFYRKIKVIDFNFFFLVRCSTYYERNQLAMILIIDAR